MTTFSRCATEFGTLAAAEEAAVFDVPVEASKPGTPVQVTPYSSATDWRRDGTGRSSPLRSAAKAVSARCGHDSARAGENAKLVGLIGTLERGARTRPSYRETVALLSRALDLSPEAEALLVDASAVAGAPIALAGPLTRLDHYGSCARKADTLTTSNHNLPPELTSFGLDAEARGRVR